MMSAFLGSSCHDMSIFVATKNIDTLQICDASFVNMQQLQVQNYITKHAQTQWHAIYQLVAWVTN